MHLTWRRWLAIGAAAVAGLIGIVLLATADDADDVPSTSTTTTATTTTAAAGMGEAVAVADVHIDGVTDTEVQGLIESLCTAEDAEAMASQLVDVGTSNPYDVLVLVEGIGNGAEVLCPEVPGTQPTLLNEVYNAALTLIGERSTTTTAG